MKKINISKQVQLPMDAATQKFAFLGRSGSGKSYGAGKLAESFLENHIQTIILDPVGIWYGLRVAADGKSKGLSIPVFGGEHGDIDLLPGSGALIATLIVEKGISAVLDVSYMRKNERKQFITDFAETLFFLKKKNRSVLHLIIEESQVFVPQRTIKGEERMLGAMEDICKLGRNYGIGISLISQRPQSVHKDCLNQTEALFAFQINGAHERKAIADWVVEKGIEKKAQLDYISELEVGECFLWSPQWLKLLEKINILPKKTFDASKTPEVGDAVIKPRNLAPVDLEQIKEQMKSVIEEKKKDDPRELHRQIAELKREKQLAEKQILPEIPMGRSKNDEKIIEQQKQFIVQLQQREKSYINLFKKICSHLQKAQGDFRTMNEEILPVLDAKQPEYVLPKSIKESQIIGNGRGKIIIPKRKYQIVHTLGNGGHAITNQFREHENGTLSKCEKAILTVLAQREKPSNKSQVGILSGYSSGSGGFNNAISKLRTSSYITGGGENLSITEDGLLALGNFERLPEGEELQNYWLNKLSKCEAAILKCLIEIYPHEQTKEYLGENTGYSANSGGFNNALSRLRTLELINRGSEIKASENLFE